MSFQKHQEDYGQINDQNILFLHSSKYWPEVIQSFRDLKKQVLLQNDPISMLNFEQDCFLNEGLSQGHKWQYSSIIFDEKNSTFSNNENGYSFQKQQQKQVEQQKETNNLHRKKITKKKSAQSNSIYHNYQKHLINILKKLAILPFCKGQQLYKLAASQLWKKYCISKIKTKKILHCIFNENNELLISKQQIEAYGLSQCYEIYETQVINKAKNFLSHLVAKQLISPSFDKLLLKSRMKNVSIFKQYILNFRQQLVNGFLSRRLLINQ